MLASLAVAAVLALSAATASAQQAAGPFRPTICIAEYEHRIVELSQARQYAQALAVANAFEATARSRFGEDDACYARALAHRATFLQLISRVLDAAPLFERSLAIYRQRLPAGYPELTLAINNLGSNLFWQRRYAEAARLHEEALQSRQRALPLDEQAVADSLHNLADTYRYLGRPPADVLALYRRSLEIRTRVLQPDDPAIGQSLQNMASVNELMGDLAGAEQHLLKALAVYRRAAQPDAQVMGGVLSRLGAIAFQKGDLGKAEAQFRDAVRYLKGPGVLPSMALAAVLDDLAVNQMEQQRLDDARSLLAEALSVRRQVLPPTHATIGRTLSNLSEVAWRQKRFAEALETSREASRIAAALGRTDAAGRLRLQRHIRAAWFAASKHEGQIWQRLGDEAFVLAQRAISADIGQVIARMSARLAAGNAALRTLLRSGEELQRERDLLELQLSHSFSLPPEEQARVFAEVRSGLAALDRRRAEIEAKVKDAYPQYTTLVAPSPLPIREVQDLLKPDEALVAIHVSFDAVYVWTATATAARWTRAKLGVLELEASVAKLRAGLDRSAQAGRAAESLGPRQAPSFPPFDLGLAHELYTALLGESRDLIAGRHLLVVPSGPLTSLPFHVLVTNRPEKPVPDRVDDYGRAAWLARRHAVTVLPSVASLAALRRLPTTTRAPKPYIGFGDPLLTGPLGTDRRAWAVEPCAEMRPPVQVAASGYGADAGMPRGVSSYFRSGSANIAAVRKLVPLPETAGELCDVARSLGSTDDSVLLGAAATEAALKAMSASGRLADARVVHFATHGLVAGELGGLAEPALVLSPPPEGAPAAGLEQDDGLLTASEVAQLRLNADWVVLSACNTAAGEKGNAEALSGLARAFFHAGARALLVSHWQVQSAAAVKLITRTFAGLRDRPDGGGAEALRQAMLATMAEGGAMAHPAAWSPFVVVGEGRPR